MIVKKGSKYAVVSHRTHKTLATYSSRKEAEADLKRRAGFKHKGKGK